MLNLSDRDCRTDTKSSNSHKASVSLVKRLHIVFQSENVVSQNNRKEFRFRVCIQSVLCEEVPSYFDTICADPGDTVCLSRNTSVLATTVLAKEQKKSRNRINPFHKAMLLACVMKSIPFQRNGKTLLAVLMERCAVCLGCSNAISG